MGTLQIKQISKNEGQELKKDHKTRTQWAACINEPRQIRYYQNTKHTVKVNIFTKTYKKTITLVNLLATQTLLTFTKIGVAAAGSWKVNDTNPVEIDINLQFQNLNRYDCLKTYK